MTGDTVDENGQPITWVRLSDEAKRAGLHRITLQRWLKAGRIKGFKMSAKMWMVQRGCVDDLMARLAAEHSSGVTTEAANLLNSILSLSEVERQWLIKEATKGDQ